MKEDREELRKATIEASPEAKTDNTELKNSWYAINEKIKDVPQLLKFTHRQKLFIAALALGWTQERIARALGTNASTIGKWAKNPENDLVLTEVQFRLGIRPVAEYFKEQLMPSVRTMIEIRDNRELDSNVRLRAAQLITEFAIGKPTQTVENKGTDIKSLLREVRKQATNTSEIRTQDIANTPITTEKQ